MTKIKKGDCLVRVDGQIGIADSEVNEKTGRIWVIFDTERPAQYIEAHRVKLYEPEGETNA